MLRRSKVHPSEGYTELDESHEMREVNHYENFNPARKRSWQMVGKQVTSLCRWKTYQNSMRSQVSSKAVQRGNECTGNEARQLQRTNAHCVLDSDVDFLGKENFSNTYDSFINSSTEESNLALVSSRTLIIYFAKLAKASLDESQVIDFEFLEEMFSRGADINFTDRHGQTIFHEVARIWNVDVAKFFIEHGADVNSADDFGRTPLHIAAAVDYPEMVAFLAANNANIHAETKTERQTPTHYASKNDAVKALKKLLELGGRSDSRDYKGRTPLQVAAELDRSETAKLLIEQGANAGVQDDSGSCALSMMITKMPPVAKLALDQFHSTDRANRRQYYYLNYLEPYKPSKGVEWHAKTPLQCLVHFKQMELIMHPVFRRLIDVKWKQFGRRAVAWRLIVQLVYVLIWTALAVTLHIGKEAHYYYPPSTYWWRIVMEGIVCSMTLYFILEELLEFRMSSSMHRKWQHWRIRELQKDLQFCHPRWPAERKYLEMELKEISESGISYFTDGWNYFDWITYGWVLGIFITRGLDVGLNNKAAVYIHPRLFAVAIIFIWLRLMKAFRAISAIGPFIVMISHIITDTLKFGFLFFEFYFPYVCAFWIVFGHSTMKDNKLSPAGLESFDDLMYSVWQITYVGNFPYDKMLQVDRLMAQLLCGTYIAVSGIVLLNLFIALMSDTFQRVYDNAVANAEMQRASLILSMEEGMNASTRDAYRRHFHARLAPEEQYYDDDSTTPESGDLEKMTHQIKDVVDDVYDIVKDSEQNSHGSANKEIMRLRDEMTSAGERHEQHVKEMRQEISEMKQMLDVLMKNIQQKQQSPSPSSPPSLSHQKQIKPSRSSHRKKHRREHSYQIDGEDRYEEPYEGLPLGPAPNDDILPSVSSMLGRNTPRKDNTQHL